jgi:hypothetical protein
MALMVAMVAMAAMAAADEDPMEGDRGSSLHKSVEDFDNHQ